jgi:hypothetical protein
MVRLFDTAVQHLDKGLAVAQATSNVELQRQILGARAKAKYQKALWQKLKPARTRPAGPADQRRRRRGGREGRAGNDAVGLPVAAHAGREQSRRPEHRLRDEPAARDPGRQRVRRPGGAGEHPARAPDRRDPAHRPVTGQADPTLARAIDRVLPAGVGELVAFTVVSAREMHLIIAEAALAAGNTAEFVSRINTVRALSGCRRTTGRAPPPRRCSSTHGGVTCSCRGTACTTCIASGSAPTTGPPRRSRSRRACFFPIANIERQANRSAPQPAQARAPYCT